jgi:hypothetical protein
MCVCVCVCVCVARGASVCPHCEYRDVRLETALKTHSVT